MDSVPSGLLDFRTQVQLPDLVSQAQIHNLLVSADNGFVSVAVNGIAVYSRSPGQTPEDFGSIINIGDVGSGSFHPGLNAIDFIIKNAGYNFGTGPSPAALRVQGTVEASAVVVADSVSGFSGVQGAANWYYGYTIGPYARDAFKQFALYDGYWHRELGSGGYWTQLTSVGGHPNGTNGNGGRVSELNTAVRRWISDVTGAVRISGQTQKIGGGNTQTSIYVNGSSIYSAGAGSDYAVSVSIHVGDKIDFVIDPAGDDVNDTTGFTSTITSNPASSPWTTGHFSGGMNFHGLTEIPLPNDLVRPLTVLTIEGWFNTTASGVIFGAQSTDIGGSPNDWEPMIYVGLDGKLRAKFWENRATIGPMTTSSAVNDGNWHHFALVGDRTIQSLYLDGAQIASVFGTITHVTDSYNQVGTGFTASSGDWPSTNGGWFPFYGTLDDIRVWSVARQLPDIVSDMSAEAVGNEQGLISYLKLNDTIGNSALDSATGAHYSIVGAVPTDLVVQNVTFSAPTVTSGDALNLSFRVRNLGNATAPPTKARLRLTADQVLTLYDKPLSPLDVNIPAIPGGSYYDYTGTFSVPSGTPAGQYYVGVFADAFNVANQSDITNDAGLSSTALSVASPAGVVPPTITQQPQSLSLSQGDSGLFSVMVSGTSPFTYEWRHGNMLVLQTTTSSTTSSIQFATASSTQAGSYSVAISNAAGSIASNSVTLTLSGTTSPAIPTTPTLVPDPFHPWDSSLPTIVISHGWQPSHDPQNTYAAFVASDYDWLGTLRAHIYTQLAAQGRSANICLFIWRDAFTDWFYPTDYYNAQRATLNAGHILAQKLGDLFDPSTYLKGVQFIGHSLGSIVNAYAVDELNRRNTSANIEQFTILDAPMKLRLLPGFSKVELAANLLAEATGSVYSSNWFHQMLPSSGPHAVELVDNYFGDLPFGFGDHLSVLGVGGYGNPISGAANLELAKDHSGVHQYYDDNDLFEHSFIFGDPIKTWTGAAQTTAIFTSLVNTVADSALPGWSVLSGNAVSSVLLDAGQSITGMILTAVASPSFTPPLGGPPLDPITATEVALDVTIPQNATALTFDSEVVQYSDQRWINVAFNGIPLIALSDANTSASDFQRETIPVGLIAGQSGVLSVAIDGSAPVQTQLALTNFRFIDEAPPIPAGDFDPKTAQAISVRFNEPITAPTATVLQLNYKGPDTPPPTLPPLGLTMTEDSTDAIWTPQAGMLPDGNYIATLPTNSIQDTSGNGLADDYIFEFFVLAGDANHDRHINALDFNALASSFGDTGATFNAGDFNYDGKVDTIDFNLLASHFGTFLSPPTLSAAQKSFSPISPSSHSAGVSNTPARLPSHSFLFSAAPFSKAVTDSFFDEFDRRDLVIRVPVVVRFPSLRVNRGHERITL